MLYAADRRSTKVATSFARAKAVRARAEAQPRRDAVGLGEQAREAAFRSHGITLLAAKGRQRVEAAPHALSWRRAPRARLLGRLLLLGLGDRRVALGDARSLGRRDAFLRLCSTAITRVVTNVVGQVGLLERRGKGGERILRCIVAIGAGARLVAWCVSVCAPGRGRRARCSKRRPRELPHMAGLLGTDGRALLGAPGTRDLAYLERRIDHRHAGAACWGTTFAGWVHAQ